MKQVSGTLHTDVRQLAMPWLCSLGEMLTCLLGPVCRKCQSNLQECAGWYGRGAHHSDSETDAKRSGILPRQRPNEEITRGSSTCGWKDSHNMPVWKLCRTRAFLAGAIGGQPLIIPPIPISWQSEEPIWVEQWPLNKKKLEAAQTLVLEQLAAGHIVSSTSPQNTPIFVIKKKSGKWCLLQDLRAVNKTMIPTGATQLGLPAPTAIPKDWHLIIIGLNDCFFTIPLHPADCHHFAFSVPSTKLKEPYKRCHWVVLPQEMANSPTICQIYVALAIERVRLKHPQLFFITWTIFHWQDPLKPLC